MSTLTPQRDINRNFYHPYTPYEIQKQFMSTVYRCIEEGKVGILESPTGTGKSLSLICGSLTWLRDHKRRVFEEGLNLQTDGDDEPDWMLAHVREQKRRNAVRRREDLESRLARVREKEEKMKARYESGEPMSKRRKVDNGGNQVEDDEAAFLPDEYESDDMAKDGKKVSTTSEFGLSSTTQALMEKLGMSIPGQKNDKDNGDLPDETKVIYCSRTHSQITQFINELRRVKIPGSVTTDKTSLTSASTIGSEPTIEEFRHVTLGSRKNLCINPKVAKLGSVTAINERCLELQRPGAAPESKCPYLPNKDNEALVLDFRDHAMAKIRDIEDFGKLGKKLEICPYYAARAAVKPMEIVTLPYPLLLQKSAREALGITLKDHIVIIDEAHNLMDAIAQIHSVSVTDAQLALARAQLLGYLQKFKNKLKGRNRIYVTQLVRVIDSLSGYLQGRLTYTKDTDGQAQIGDLMSGKGADQVNLHKLMRYLQESKLARKIERYAVWSEEQQEFATLASREDKKLPSKPGTTMPVLTHLQGFLMALTYPAAEGQFFFEKAGEGLQSPGAAVLKYQLLDPTYHFREIVDEARAVILAGGTMSPMSDYTTHLFPYLPQARLETVSFGHVIPPSNLFATSIAKGPSGTEFDFTYEKRNSPAMIRELGQAVLALAKTIPDGLVIFFPSYAYLATVTAAWQKPSSTGVGASTTSQETIWTQLSQYKKIFLEPKSSNPASAPSPSTLSSAPATSTTPIRAPEHSQAPDTHRPSRTDTTALSTPDKLLAAYTAHIQSKQGGALLLAVIGGSLSEGINFSDALGRGVAVVGLPFPNARSAEWKARLDFISSRPLTSTTTTSITTTTTTSSTTTLGVGVKGIKGKGLDTAISRAFLENTTMRAVNQSVGRAIRHKDDYAAILLLDRRYEGERMVGKLPGWIGEGFRRGLGFEGVVGGLRRFFEGKEGGR